MSDAVGLPAHVTGSGSLERLVKTASNYARAAASENTLKAYAKDWEHFARWCRIKGAEATSTHDYFQLSRLSRWHVDSDAINQTLAMVIEAPVRLPMAQFWGGVSPRPVMGNSSLPPGREKP